MQQTPNPPPPPKWAALVNVRVAQGRGFAFAHLLETLPSQVVLSEPDPKFIVPTSKLREWQDRAAAAYGVAPGAVTIEGWRFVAQDDDWPARA